MQIIADRPQAAAAVRTDLGAIFVSLELSLSTWLITSLCIHLPKAALPSAPAATTKTDCGKLPMLDRTGRLFSRAAGSATRRWRCTSRRSSPR